MNQRRMNGVCPKCRRPASVAVVELERPAPGPREYMGRRYTFVDAAGTKYLEKDIGGQNILLPCPNCGTWMSARPVVGRVNPKIQCDARCMEATGNKCECACGGRNHGASFDPTSPSCRR